MDKMKKIVAIVICMCICLVTECTVVEADESASLYKADINTREITLYGLSSSYDGILTIPEEFATEYKLSVSNAKNVSYRVSDGDNIVVDDKGNVGILYKTWYTYGNVSYTHMLEGKKPDSVKTSFEQGDATVTVTADSSEFKVKVHVIAYSVVYADNKIKEYIANNITGKNLSDIDLMNKIAEYPASFDYGDEHSGYDTMIIFGSGDCWASTSLVLKMCDLLGIKAWARNGNKDTGAGGGHMNALVNYNGAYYEIEAGIDGSAPRVYYVDKRDSLFCFRYYSSNSQSVYQYDGNDSSLKKLIIPELHDGYLIKSIDDEFSSGSYRDYEEVVIPGTVENIGEYAFAGCRNLTTINIPKSVQNIGINAFAQCLKLKTINCSSDNSKYSVQNGVIYNKDKSVVVQAPAVDNLVLSSTVKSVSQGAFAFNSNLNNITIPVSVDSIGEKAFLGCYSLEKVFIYNSNIDIGEYAFYECGNVTVYGVKGSNAQKYAENNGISFIDINSVIPQAKKIIDGSLKDIKVSNNLTKDDISKNIDNALKAASNTDVKIDIKEFTKTKATDTQVGSIHAVIGMSFENMSDTISYDATISRLPNDGEKLNSAKDVVENTVKDIKVTNDFNKENLHSLIENVLKNAGLSQVKVDISKFDLLKATSHDVGKVNVELKLSSGVSSITYSFSKSIEKLPKTDAERVADAKAIIQSALKNVKNSIDISYKDVQSALDSALQTNKENNVTAYINSFSKTTSTADDGNIIKIVSVSAVIAIEYGSASENVYFDRAISQGERNVTGVVQAIDGNWYYFKNGQIDYTCNDIMKNNYGWWVIRSGKVDFGFTGIASNSYGNWYCKGGKVQFDLTSVVQSNTDGFKGWYYVNGGKVQKRETVQKNSNGWWYVGTDGKVDFNFNGLAKNDYGWWVIQNGQVNFKYNGIASNQYGSWYCKAGQVDFKAGGVLNTSQGWYYVKGGKVQTGSETVQKNSNGWWYIGTDGKVDFNKDTVAKNDYGWWVIQNGQVNFKYTGIAANQFGSWYCELGRVNFDYTGEYKEADGKTYNIQNGKSI